MDTATEVIKEMGCRQRADFQQIFQTTLASQDEGIIQCILELTPAACSALLLRQQGQNLYSLDTQVVVRSYKRFMLAPVTTNYNAFINTPAKMSSLASQGALKTPSSDPVSYTTKRQEKASPPLQTALFFASLCPCQVMPKGIPKIPP